MNNTHAEYCKDGELIICKPLNKDCEDIVQDLINSAHITQNWTKEKKYQYFHRVVSIVYDLASRPPKNKFRVVLEDIKNRFFLLLSRLVIYVP